MKVRYRETDKTAEVELRQDAAQGLILVGKDDVFYGAGLREPNRMEWAVGADTFSDDWNLVEASAEERRRLVEAGFQLKE